MLSFCVPEYNYDITVLVSELQKQAIEENIPYEILVIDDASKEEFKFKNQPIRKLQGVRYLELKQNVGRSKIRNLLAREAKYNNLIFMDCDAEVPVNYLKNYIPFLEKNIVTIGGVSYSEEKPSKKYMLRWKYGRKRECPNSFERNKNPYNSFKTFNFLIPKSIFQKVNFNESILEYGHEDTLFGLDLKKQNIVVTHIDNPLIHIGLEPNDIFLNKTKAGIKNLSILSLNKNISAEFSESISLLRFYNKIPSFGKNIIAFKFRVLKSALEFLLIKGKCPMILFDFYKLGYLCSLKNENLK